jgi:hypothetical protein
MKLKTVAIIAPLAGTLFCGVAWGQQALGSPSPANPTAKSSQNTPKESHWSGSLVDVACMAKALGSENSANPPAAPAFSMLHFTAEDPASPQAGPPSGVNGQGGMAPGQRGQEPGPPTTTDSGMSPEEQARANQASKVDNAAKACAASPSSQALGLATSDGQVMQFDPDGNAKAKEALKDADLQPGKKIKAKVTGIMEDKTTVKVAEVNVKGKGRAKGK